MGQVFPPGTLCVSASQGRAAADPAQVAPKVPALAVPRGFGWMSCPAPCSAADSPCLLWGLRVHDDVSRVMLYLACPLIVHSLTPDLARARAWCC